MKTIFENQCTYTYNYYLQLKRKTMDKSFVRTAYWILGIVAVIQAFCVFKGWMGTLVFGVPILLFTLYRLIGTPIRLAFFAYSKNREIHGQDVVTVNNFYEDHVLAINALTKNKTNIKYVEVKQVIQTRDLYIIVMEQGLVLMMDKHGFNKGTKEDFAEFMKEKCVNAEVNL